MIGAALEKAAHPTPELYNCAMTKAATRNCVRSLSKRLAPKGVRVDGVAPGPI